MDPIFGRALEAIRTETKQAIAIQVRPRRFWLAWLSTLHLRASSRWSTWLLGLLTALLVTSGGIFLILGSYGDASERSAFEITLAAATALGVSTIVVSSISLPHSLAASISPGFTASVNNKNYPWALGAALVALTVVLFMIAAAHPDATAATGTALLACAGLSAAWLVSKLLLLNADLLSIAQRQAAHLERSAAAGERFYLSAFKHQLPKSLRTRDSLGLLLEDDIVGVLNGMLRQARSGIHAAQAAGHDQIVPIYFDSMIRMFARFARSHDGRIGTFDGPVNTLASTYRHIVDEGLSRRGEAEASAVYCTDRLHQLDVPEATDPQFSVLHQRLRPVLNESLEASFSEDWSQLPSAIVNAESKLFVASLKSGATIAARVWHQALEAHFLRAALHSQAPIATHCLARHMNTISNILALESKHDRKHFLMSIFTLCTAIEKQMPVGGHSVAHQSLQLFFPGLTISGSGIQSSVAGLELSPNLCLELEEAICIAAQTYCTQAELRERLDDQYLDDALTLLYFISVDYARRGISASKALEVSLRLVEHRVEKNVEIFLSDDVAELIWSIISVHGAMSGDASVFAETCQQLVDMLPKIEELQNSLSEYQATFMSGLLICAKRTGWNPQLKRELMEDDYHPAYAHISGYANAPTINRNKVIHSEEVVDAVNAWIANLAPSITNVSN